MDALRLQNVTKSFGATPVIRDISLSVPQGSVFGFIGANGAGKTTTMKMVLGLLKPDSGQAFVLGEPVRFGMTATNRHIGFLPDVPEFYPYLRAAEYLRLCAAVAGLSAAQTKTRSDGLLELVGLRGVNKKIGSYSRGMKQRLGMAQALINRPRVLICDEPTSALDPAGRKDVLEILRRVAGETTVVFSTHVLSDVERICDTVAVLHEGRIALEGTLEQLKARRKNDSLLLGFATVGECVHFRTLLPDVLARSCEVDGAELVVHVADRVSTQRELLRLVEWSGLLPLRFEVLEPSIENLYLEVTTP